MLAFISLRSRYITTRDVSSLQPDSLSRWEKSHRTYDSDLLLWLEDICVIDAHRNEHKLYCTRRPWTMTKNDLDDTVTLFYYDTNILVGILVLAFPEPGLAGPLRGRFWHDSKDLLSEPGVLYLAIRSLSGRLGFPGHIKQIVGRSRSLTRTDSIAWRRSISVSYDTGRCRLAGDPGSSTSSTSSTSSGTGRRQGRVGRGAVALLPRAECSHRIYRVNPTWPRCIHVVR